MVKNPLAMWETWVHSLGWENPLEKYSGLENSMDCIVMKESDMTEQFSLIPLISIHNSS